MTKYRYLASVLTLTLLVISVCSVSCNTQPGVTGVYNNTSGTIWVEYNGYFDNLTALCEDAQVIVVGNVIENIDVVPDVATRGQLFNTTSGFEVESILKGYPAKKIVISQTGAVGKAEEVGNPILHAGERYVLFLTVNDEYTFHILNGPVGRYRVFNNKVSSMNYVLVSVPGLVIPQGLMFWRVDLDEFAARISKVIDENREN